MVKPQVAFFERHGAAGVAVLEELVAEAGRAGLLVIGDAKRGDIGSTVEAYADAWLGRGSPLAVDAVTAAAVHGARGAAADGGRGAPAGPAGSWWWSGGRTPRAGRSRRR